MKRVFALTLCAVLALSLLSACGSPGAAGVSDPPASTGPSQDIPAQEPSLALPSDAPSAEPSTEPSDTPSAEPSQEPSVAPTQKPSTEPSEKPSTPQPTPDAEPSLSLPPEPEATPTPEETNPEGSPAPVAGVDLEAFYTDVTNLNEFGFLELAPAELLDGYYPGLTGIATEQCLVYICMISMNNGEFGLVQVKDNADVDAVKAIFQARVDYMVGDGTGPGDAQYPMAMDQWENNSRIVSNGDYIMMVVHENCDDIVDQFNALF